MTKQICYKRRHRLLNSNILKVLYTGLEKIYGPYKSKDGRYRVQLKLPNGFRVRQYAKLKIECHIRRLLVSKETVNHKDRNKSNDRISNLEVLDKILHSRLDAIKRVPTKAVCIWCKTKFLLSPAQVSGQNRKEKAGPFCSRKCTGQYGASIQNGRTKSLNRKKYKIKYTY